jgi:hypothetical protein
VSDGFAEHPPENLGRIHSAGILVGCFESVLALGAAGVTPRQPAAGTAALRSFCGCGREA